MIVIHPKDKTTSFLKAIYAGKKDVTLIDETWSSRNIRETIGNASKKEIIMMLEEIRKRAGMPHYYRPNVTEIKDVSPESFDFVIGAAIVALINKNRGEKDDD